MGAVQDDAAWEAARAARYDDFIAARDADDPGAMAAAALGLAALQSGAYGPQADEIVALVICGANLDPATLA